MKKTELKCEFEGCGRPATHEIFFRDTELREDWYDDPKAMMMFTCGLDEHRIALSVSEGRDEYTGITEIY